MARARLARRALACVVVLLAALGCAGPSGPSGSPPVERRDPDRLRIASYDFSENQVLAEVYGQQLRRAGFAVDILTGLGSRDIVVPSMEQGLVDVVIDYTGSMLDYIGGSPADAHGTPKEVHAAVAQRLGELGLTALQPASAEDTNGYAVTVEFARKHQVSRISDLRPLANHLVFGGPPECRTRRYCLVGLQNTYGLQFADFRPEPSRSATAAALQTGEIDVGMLETTYGRLGERRVMLLNDDLGLQPRENVFPVIRTAVTLRYGSRLTAALAAISEQLTTPRLVQLNQAMSTDPVGASAVATRYLDRLDR